MSKFKVRDRVRVKENLLVGGFYDGCFFAHTMAKTMGKVVTISAVTASGRYRIKEDNELCVYAEEMLEELTLKRRLVDYKTIVRVRDGRTAILAGDEFLTKKQLSSENSCSMRLNDISDTLKAKGCKEFDIVKYKIFNRTSDALRTLLQDKKISWDWERIDPIEKTLEELLKIAEEKEGKPVVLKIKED